MKLSRIFILVVFLMINACATRQITLYQELGEREGLELIVDNFISEISFNQQIYKFFEESNIERFRSKMIEHLCLHANGPCKYSGDTMTQVHTGMNISEGDFNLVVELLIKAMAKARIPQSSQNKLLAKLAPMRIDMLYL